MRAPFAELAGLGARRFLWDGLGPGLRALEPRLALKGVQALCELGALRPRRGVSEAMARVLPADEVGPLARQEAAFHLRQRLELQLFPRLDARQLRARVAFSGRDHLDAAVSAGGAVLATAHFGLHGLPPVALSVAGYPVATRTFMRPDDSFGPAAAYGQRRRRALEDTLPVRYLRCAAGDARDDADAAAADWLASGGLLIASGDGLGPEDLLGEVPTVLPLCGQPTAWPRDAFRLAATHGVPVLSVWSIAEESGHVLHVGPPLDPRAPLQDFVQRYPALLLAAPAQWQFWDRFHPGALIRPSTPLAAR